MCGPEPSRFGRVGPTSLFHLAHHFVKVSDQIQMLRVSVLRHLPELCQDKLRARFLLIGGFEEILMIMCL